MGDVVGEALAVPYERIVLVLALTAAATVALAWVTRRALGLHRAAPGAERLLALGDALALGPRRQVVVVRAGTRRLVVAFSGDTVAHLGDLPPDSVAPDPAGVELVDEPAPPPAREATPPPPRPARDGEEFARVLAAARSFEARRGLEVVA